MSTGKLIVIEGGDGAGKATQTKLAVERLRTGGEPVATISFPQYGKACAAKVEAYLRGDLGPMKTIEPWDAAKFFAEDRIEAKPWILSQLASGVHVVSDRWVPSNMVHQGAKIADPVSRSAFFAWVEQYEYDGLGSQRPDLVIVLSVASDVRHVNVGKKEARDYLKGGKVDEHEADLPYQERVERIYREIATTMPGYVLIDCMDAEAKLMSPETIHELIWAEVSKVLARSFA